ncbi:MAG: amidohydrolase family protein [Deltaproteobacteria bacterium]|nr:amidohydrolase family protein [Deltaproteobacteria bacterium]MBW2359966.1 amidohydrolase family protein [Deltaproteobacteria bacterium]
MTASAPSRIISADCHINEPPHVFDGVPAALKDRAPKMLRGADGGDGWSFDGKPPGRTFGIEATAGRAAGDKKMSGLRFDEILRGNYEGAAHVEDMRTDGVDVSIVYPAYAAQSYAEPDRELALACMRSYNDWMLSEFQAAAPEHLLGLPMLPVDDGMEVCLAEFERCLEAGAKAGFLPGLPTRPYHDPYYDPLFARVSEARMPLTFHRTFGGRPAASDWDELIGMKITAAGTVERFFSSVRPFSYMVYGGVFERHPGLKIVAAEVNFGWLPFWVQTMEQNFTVRSGLGDSTVATRKRPTDYMGENLFVTIIDDKVGFDLVASYPWLADTALWSSDYPHSVSAWPNSRKVLTELGSALTSEQLEKIAHGNAARIYGV